MDHVGLSRLDEADDSSSWSRKRGTNQCTVLDPFMGSGTTAIVAKRLGGNFIGFELNLAYVRTAEARLKRLMDNEPQGGDATGLCA